MLKGKSHLMRKTVVLGVLFVGGAFAQSGWDLNTQNLTVTNYTGTKYAKAGVGLPSSATSLKWALEARTIGVNAGADSNWKALRLSLGSGITNNITLNATVNASKYFVISNDTGSGIIFSTGTLQGSTTGIGTERMRILSSNGYVGLGITDPGSLLQVNGSAAIGYSTSQVAPNNGLLVSGSVGIGTPPNTGKLEVDAETNALNGIHATANASGYYAIYAEGGSGSDGAIRVYARGSGTGISVQTQGGLAGDFGGDVTVSGKLKINSWTIEAPDYVFERDYKLPSLKEVEKQITTHKHLPDMPSAADMKKNGIDLTEMNMKLLKKVEELTLYVIAQNKKIEALEKKGNERK